MGFILAAAGSAIGLGNIWRFPYAAAESGGGAFILVYLAFVIGIGLPVLLAELSLGRHTGGNPVGAFKKLVPDSLWPLVGGLGVLTGFGILAFYSVVAGWTLSYLWRAATGAFASGLTHDESATLFGHIIGDAGETTVMTAAFLVLTAAVVRGGVGGGIEKAAKVLMPTFFVVLVLLAIRAVTLPGAGAGIDFLLQFDTSKIDAKVIGFALGQALFSLSLGMGAMITYGSYLSKKENLAGAAVSVAIFDTAIALLAGFMIFPALFAAGAKPEVGAGLVFIVLPTIFGQVPAGVLFSVAFYALLGIAALTSTISLMEVVVAYFVDERKWTRQRAVWTVAAACFVLAVPSALSQGASEPLTNLIAKEEPGKFFGFLDTQSIVWGNYALSVGALLIAVFVGWVWGSDKARKEIGDLPGGALWELSIKYLCPLGVLGILAYLLITGETF
jgi:NSS family neurotransmitter:Na+ symporter